MMPERTVVLVDEVVKAPAAVIGEVILVILGPGWAREMASAHDSKSI